jgi:hypothetical protein
LSIAWRRSSTQRVRTALRLRVLRAACARWRVDAATIGEPAVRSENGSFVAWRKTEPGKQSAPCLPRRSDGSLITLARQYWVLSWTRVLPMSPKSFLQAMVAGAACLRHAVPATNG